MSDDVLIAVDPHKASNTAAVLDPVSKTVIEAARFANTIDGYAQLTAFAARWSQRRWAVEGCHRAGRSLARTSERWASSSPAPAGQPGKEPAIVGARPLTPRPRRSQPRDGGTVRPCKARRPPVPPCLDRRGRSTIGMQADLPARVGACHG